MFTMTTIWTHISGIVLSSILSLSMYISSKIHVSVNWANVFTGQSTRAKTNWHVNECKSNPCMNGGTCTDKVYRYTCKCPDGYTGANCESRKSDCNSYVKRNGKGIVITKTWQKIIRHIFHDIKEKWTMSFNESGVGQNFSKYCSSVLFLSVIYLTFKMTWCRKMYCLQISGHMLPVNLEYKTFILKIICEYAGYIGDGICRNGQ